VIVPHDVGRVPKFTHRYTTAERCRNLSAYQAAAEDYEPKWHLVSNGRMLQLTKDDDRKRLSGLHEVGRVGPDWGI
jgi:hypothetical protein